MKKRQQLINLAYADPKYWGKHIVILGGKIYAARSGAKASQILERLLKKCPSETPIITYIPSAETLILFLS